MIREAPYSDDLRPALDCVNNRPERTACWLERWMIHRPNGGFAMYLVNWEIRSDADFQLSITRVPELTDPRLMAAVTFTQPANDWWRVSGVVVRMSDTHHLETKI
jgi:hypothetical protein